jgi:hypothetical protein
VELLEDMLFVGLGGMLSVELVKVVDDLVWRNIRIDNTPNVEFDWFDKLVLEKAKDRMGNIGGGGALHGVINSLGADFCEGFAESCSIFSL